MNRRSFLAALFASPLAPVVAKLMPKPTTGGLFNPHENIAARYKKDLGSILSRYRSIENPFLATAEELRFLRGNQWPPEVMRARLASGRPCVIVNQVEPLFKEIVNNSRVSGEEFTEEQMLSVAGDLVRKTRDSQMLANYFESSRLEWRRVLRIIQPDGSAKTVLINEGRGV